MSQSVHFVDSIKLRKSSILNVPIESYPQDFTFIVNGEEFHTSRLVADLLSPRISKQHLSDPTITEYSINTRNTGDFKQILNLVNFEALEVKEEEALFIVEVLESLENTLRSVKRGNQQKLRESEGSEQESSISEVLVELDKHRGFPNFYESEIEEEVRYVSMHISSMNAEDKKIFIGFGLELIERIMSSSSVRVESEDEILDIVNELYSKDSIYAALYSCVYFENVSVEKMKEFVDGFSFDDLTNESWRSLCVRLLKEIKYFEEDTQRYKTTRMKSKKTKRIPFENQEFRGIICYLKEKANIKDEIDISSSSIATGGGSKDPWSVISFDEQNLQFYTEVEDKTWLCIEFKKHEINPTHFTIRSGDDDDNPKHFVLEGSKDKSTWTTIDEETESSCLRSKRSVHTFNIQPENKQAFKYLRLRHIGNNWSNQQRLQIHSIELYGELIESS